MNPILIIIVGGLTIMTVLIGILAAIGLSRMERYRQDIIFLETVIDHWIVTRNNYCLLNQLFSDISRNDMDPIRTFRAQIKFHERFKEFFPTPTLEEKMEELINQN